MHLELDILINLNVINKYQLFVHGYKEFIAQN